MLGLMFLLAAGLGVRMVRQQGGDTAAPKPRPISSSEEPVKPKAYAPYQLSNEGTFEEVSQALGERSSIFLPYRTPGPHGPNRPPEEAPPTIEVRRVFQPTADGPWVAQLVVNGKAYFPREGQSFANNAYELVRIDKTRECVEIVRNSDDTTHEACKST